MIDLNELERLLTSERIGPLAHTIMECDHCYGDNVETVGDKDIVRDHIMHKDGCFVPIILVELRAGQELAEAADRLTELEQEVSRLRLALEKIEPLIGWRGRAEKSTEGYYCEFCKAYHEAVDLIIHWKDCPMVMVRQALGRG